MFGVLIAVHELGHFLAAKACGVRVNEFAIGMGPAIFQKQKGETLYALRILPVGGYCAMEGEDEESDDPRSLAHQGFWKKFFIFAAGAAMNFITGVLIILVLYAGVTAFYTAEIADFATGFPTELQGENGLMKGDILYKIDGNRVYLYNDAQTFLQFNDGEGIDLVVLRDGEKVVLDDFPMYRRTYDGKEGKFGLTVGKYAEEATVGVRLKYTWYTALEFVQLVKFSLEQLFTGGASVKDLSGPVGIVSTITQVGQESETAKAAVDNILYFAALIAINLAVMNLLPLPALDGGKIFFLVLDSVTMLLFKRKIPEKYENYIHAAGLALLLGLMLLVTFQDIWKLFQ